MLRPHILAAHKMGVVGDDHRNTEFAADPHQLVVDALKLRRILVEL